MSTPISTGQFATYISPYSKGTSFGYVYDPSTVIYSPATTPVTGGFRPVAAADFGGGVGTYSSSFSIVTGGVASLNGTIPAGAKSWSVNVISGGAYVNGTGAIPQGVILNGGGYGTSVLSSSSILVSGASAASKIILQWET